MRVRDVGMFVGGALLGCLTLLAILPPGAASDGRATASTPAASVGSGPAERAGSAVGAPIAAEAETQTEVGRTLRVAADASGPRPLPPGAAVVFVDGEAMLCDAACGAGHVAPVLARLLAGELSGKEFGEARALNRAMAARLDQDPALRARFLAALPTLFDDERSGLAFGVLRHDAELRTEAAVSLASDPDPARRRLAMDIVTMGTMGPQEPTLRERRLLERALATEQDEAALLSALNGATQVPGGVPGAGDRAVALALYGSNETIREVAFESAVRLDPALPEVQRLARTRLRGDDPKAQVQVLFTAMNAARGRSDPGAGLGFYRAEARRLAEDEATPEEVRRAARAMLRRTDPNRSETGGRSRLYVATD